MEPSKWDAAIDRDCGRARRLNSRGCINVTAITEMLICPRFNPPVSHHSAFSPYSRRHVLDAPRPGFAKIGIRNVDR
jgi:hypothetical protein